jgi:hypothetical protein
VPPLCAAKTYTNGTVVNLTAVPSTGCKFKKWSGDIGDNAADNATISVVMDEDRAITADFTGCYDIIVNTSTYLSGSTTINETFGSLTCSATQTSTGTIVNISAVAAEGYHFDGWKGGITSSQGNVSFVANSSSEPITAEFSLSSSPSSFPWWGWSAGGVAAFLLVVLLIGKFMSGRAKKPDDILLPM